VGGWESEAARQVSSNHGEQQLLAGEEGRQQGGGIVGGCGSNGRREGMQGLQAQRASTQQTAMCEGLGARALALPLLCTPP